MADTPKATNGKSIVVISGADAKKLAGGAIWYYVQARLVADFLMGTSGDPAILGDIAAFIASGGDMAAWLSASGTSYGLPTTVESLNASWRQWLDTRAEASAGMEPHMG